MVLIRSFIFNALFYLALILLMLLAAPSLAFGRHAAFRVARCWSSISIWLLRTICDIEVEFRGIENLPKGPFILAAKHQSILETFALVRHVDDFSFILKRELTFIPFFGWYLLRAEQIAIDRKDGRGALEQAVAKSKALLASGRKIIIFPEGTRRPVGAEPRYKIGVAKIYAAGGAPCVPVALNAGLHWPRRSFIRRPGKVVIQYLTPIESGLDRQTFFQTLQARIETATDALIAESIERDPSLARHVLNRAPT